MSSEHAFSFDASLINFKPLTKDGLIQKKLNTEGFGIYPGNGMEVVLHLYAEAEDGRVVANTKLVHEEPRYMILGKLNEFPGLEIAVKSMKMGEKSTFMFSPEYTYFSLEKFKNCDKSIIENLKAESFKTEILEKKSMEEIKKMEIADAKKYMKLYYDVELVKFDKPRPKKININPKERIEQAMDLKQEGNNLFKEKRFMEAIIKYKDAREYLKQMPNDFINDNYHNMQNSLTLNITNCHINLSQYNYALKNIEDNFVFEKIPKTFYFKSLCQMHLGDFENSYKNLLELQKVLPDEKMVKQYFDDYYKFKEETLKQLKDRSKKGIFESNLYNDKKIEENDKKYALPKFNPDENKCFYIDYLINNDEMNPLKSKFEIFKDTEKFQCFEFLKKEIKDKNIKNKEINFDFEEKESNLVLFEKINEIKDFDKFESINKYPINENALLLLHKNGEEYDIEISTQKMSETPLENYIVIGGCFYNAKIFNYLVKNKKKGVIKILDIDETLNY